MLRIAIIGAGFTGSLLAIHLLQRAAPASQVWLIEKRERFGSGLAYSTDNPSHLLNVRAANMSAFADRPADFVEWLATTNGDATGSRDPSGTFVERGTFGRYIGARLAEVLAGIPRERFHLVSDQAVTLRRAGAAWELALAGGESVTVDVAIVATGYVPPVDPGQGNPALAWGPAYHGDPWSLATTDSLPPDAPVLLLGTGLTMVDLALTLIERGHRGPINALSRRGLIPRFHAQAPAWQPFLAPPLPTTIMQLLRRVRREIALAKAAGIGWRSVIDAMRPQTIDLWRALDFGERQRFLRHLRPWLDVHRHRMAPDIARRLAEARRSGQLRIQAGRLLRAQPAGEEMVEVIYAPRGSRSEAAYRVARVVNCTGASCDYSRIRDPLVRDLLSFGLARPDPLGLGLDVTTDCALIDRDGRAADRLYAAGPITRGAFWEMTAVPDLRRQCEILADRVLAIGRGRAGISG